MLQEEVSRCKKCKLHETRKQTVFARGTGQNGVCFIGEAPGANEDEEGLPFVGKAGQLLDRIVARMGLDRDDVYVMNVIKCRPPGNRAPETDELEACRPFFEEQIALIKPKVVVVLGGTAMHGLFDIPGWISDLRGKFLEYDGIPVMPTFHPAYLLRTPGAKWKVWSDMRAVLERLGLPIPERSAE